MPFIELKYFSNALQKQSAASIILPDTSIAGPYHVMFLLHGLSDDNTAWSRNTSIERYVSGLPLIVVMPDGGRGFYSNAKEGYAFETAIAVELVELIEAYFPTKLPWCTTGLSMGGYGAVKLALKYPTRFKSGHSHSGAVLFGHTSFEAAAVRKEWTTEREAEFRRILGDTPTGGPDDICEAAAKLAPSERPAIRMDCGTSDFLLSDNREFRDYLASIGFPHEYEEFPGSHEWGYWDLHVQDAIRFHRVVLGF